MFAVGKSVELRSEKRAMDLEEWKSKKEDSPLSPLAVGQALKRSFWILTIQGIWHTSELISTAKIDMTI